MTLARLRARLVWRSVARTRSATAVSVIVVGVAVAVGYASLALGPALERPWQHAFAQARGPHVTIATSGDAGVLTRLAGSVEGVRDRGEVRSTYMLGVDLDGQTYGTLVAEAGPALPQVDRPVLTSGRWLDGRNEIVLERSFAEHHGVAVADELTLNGDEDVRVDVVGIAAVLTREPYPRSQPGASFATAETIARTRPGPPLLASLPLRLADPESAPAVAGRVALAGGPEVTVETWQELRADAVAGMRPIQAILLSFAVLLAVACGAVLLINLGAKAAARRREIALLRAVGFTPGDVGALVMGEVGLVAVAGVATGIGLGIFAVPNFAATADLVLPGTRTTGFSGPAAVAVTTAAAAVALAVSAIATRRATKTAVAHELEVPPGDGRVAGLVTRAVRAVAGPVAAVGSAQTLSRRGRGRALLTIAALTLTGVTIVAALAMEATFARSREVQSMNLPPPGFAAGGVNFATVEPTGDEDRLRPLVYSLNAVLVVIGLSSLGATALLSLRERVADVGVMKAIGLTPRDIAFSGLTAGALLALVSALISVPLGLAFFRGVYSAAGGSAATLGSPTIVSLALATVGFVLVGAVAVSGVALRAGRMAPHEALAQE